MIQPMLGYVKFKEVRNGGYRLEDDGIVPVPGSELEIQEEGNKKIIETSTYTDKRFDKDGVFKYWRVQLVIWSDEQIKLCADALENSETHTQMLSCEGIYKKSGAKRGKKGFFYCCQKRAYDVVTSSGTQYIKIKEGDIWRPLYRHTVKPAMDVDNYKNMLEDLAQIYRKLIIAEKESAAVSMAFQGENVREGGPELTEQVDQLIAAARRIAENPSYTLVQTVEKMPLRKVKHMNAKTIQECKLQGKQKVNATTHRKSYDIFENRIVKKELQLQLERLQKLKSEDSVINAKKAIWMDSDIISITNDIIKTDPLPDRSKPNDRDIELRLLPDFRYDDRKCHLWMGWRKVEENECLGISWDEEKDVYFCRLKGVWLKELYGLVKNLPGKRWVKEDGGEVGNVTDKLSGRTKDVKCSFLLDESGLLFLIWIFYKISRENISNITSVSIKAKYEEEVWGNFICNDWKKRLWTDELAEEANRAENLEVHYKIFDISSFRFSYNNDKSICYQYNQFFEEYRKLSIREKKNIRDLLVFFAGAFDLPPVLGKKSCGHLKEYKQKKKQELSHSKIDPEILQIQNLLSNAFFANLPETRERLHLTNIFMKKSAYREAYEALTILRPNLYLLDFVGKDQFPVGKLVDIYEIWCFFKLVSMFMFEYGFTIVKDDKVDKEQYNHSYATLRQSLETYLDNRNDQDFKDYEIVLEKPSLDLKISFAYNKVVYLQKNKQLQKKSQKGSHVQPDIRLCINDKYIVYMDAKCKPYWKYDTEWDEDLFGVAGLKYIKRIEDADIKSKKESESGIDELAGGKEILGSYILHPHRYLKKTLQIPCYMPSAENEQDTSSEKSVSEENGVSEKKEEEKKSWTGDKSRYFGYLAGNRYWSLDKEFPNKALCTKIHQTIYGKEVVNNDLVKELNEERDFFGRIENYRIGSVCMIPEDEQTIKNLIRLIMEYRLAKAEWKNLENYEKNSIKQSEICEKRNRSKCWNCGGEDLSVLADSTVSGNIKFFIQCRDCGDYWIETHCQKCNSKLIKHFPGYLASKDGISNIFCPYCNAFLEEKQQ